MSEQPYNGENESSPILNFWQTSLLLIAIVTFLGLVYLAIESRGNNSILVYLRDPAATFQFTPLAGAISHFGVFALLAAGAIGLFASFHVQEDRYLLRLVGLFSLLLAGDDFFMVHETLMPRVLGVSENYLFGIYALFCIAIISAYRTSLIGTAHIGLYVALGLLGASLSIDLFADYTQIGGIVEDSLKFGGLVIWSFYWLRRAHLRFWHISHPVT